MSESIGWIWWCCDVFLRVSVPFGCRGHVSMSVALSVPRSCTIVLLEQIQACFFPASHTSKQAHNLVFLITH